MEMVYFNRIKKIKSIDINYNSRNEGFIKKIEGFIIEISSQMKINIDNKNTNVVVFVYPSKSYFQKTLGFILFEKESNYKSNMNIVVLDDSETGTKEIHILVTSETGTTALAKLMVTEILKAYVVDVKKIKVVEAATENIIAKKEIVKKPKAEEQIEEIVEEPEDKTIEEDEIEELEIEAEELSEEETKKVEDKIEEIIEEKKVDLPAWLITGYYNFQKNYMNRSRSEDLGQYLEKRKIPKVENLSKKNTILKEDNRIFALQCTKVEYIIKVYGVKKLLDFFENPNIKDIFQIPKAQFEQDWKEYLKDNYIKTTMDDIKNKLAKKQPINEISEKDKIIE